MNPCHTGTRKHEGKRLELVLNAIERVSGIANFVQLLQAQWREVGISSKIKAQARAPWYEDNYKCTTNAIPLFLRSSDWDGMFALFHSSMIGSCDRLICRFSRTDNAFWRAFSSELAMF